MPKTKKTSTLRPGKIFFALLFLFLLVGSVIAIKASTNIKLASTKNLLSLAEGIIASCAKDSYRPGCYDKEIPKLMKDLSMEDTFQVTQIVQSKDTSYQFCHVLGHELSAREVDKDPSKWKEVLTRCPSGVCSNGCIHGGLQERFRAESLTDEQIFKIKPDLMDLCEARSNWHPTGLEQGSCYHALGHLSMYLTQADLNKSLSLCKEMAVKAGGRDFSRLCYDGTFMQIFQPLEPEDFALVKGKQPLKSAVASFCNSFSAEEKSSCLSESWPLFREELMASSSGLVDFCSKEQLEDQDRCYNAVTYILVVQFNFDSDKLSRYCMGLPENRKGQCFANVASRFIETDYKNIPKSVSFCVTARPFDPAGLCFDELVMYSTFNFHQGSTEFLTMCQSLPEPYKSKCLTKHG